MHQIREKPDAVEAKEFPDSGAFFAARSQERDRSAQVTQWTTQLLGSPASVPWNDPFKFVTLSDYLSLVVGCHASK